MSEQEREPGNDTADPILRIDALCDSFEDELRAGRRPQIEEFLGAEGSDRVALLRELVRLEVEYRRRAGDRPSAAQHAARYPELGEWVSGLLPAAPDPAETIAQVDPPTWSDPASSNKPAAQYRLLGAVSGYEIVAELGHGAMGVVYQARQVKVNRTVALKMIRAGMYASPAELVRFRTEAEAVARLQHPNVVQVFEVGESDGLPFFSMEFCTAGNLAKKLIDNPLNSKDGGRDGNPELHGSRARSLTPNPVPQFEDIEDANWLRIEEKTYRTLRGGFRWDSPPNLRSASRSGYPSFGQRHGGQGFRPTRTLVE